MRALDAIEERIWNSGERLIPGVTHDVAEVVRHKSSYQFFSKVIENDLLTNAFGKRDIRILDIGCGVGHGVYMLAEIPGVVVTGIDSSEDAIAYARLHYRRENVAYHVADAVEFIRDMPEFDYVVSRHSLEHIVDGIKIGATCRFGVRQMVNVPFAEPEGNPYHYEHFIRQDSFKTYPNSEFFYEDLDGVTFCDFPKKTPNSIICVSSRMGLPKVAPHFAFPLPAWYPEFLQGKWLEAVDRRSDIDTLAQEQASREANLVSRESEVTSREGKLDSRESEVASRESELSSRELQCGLREAELATDERQVAARESDLSAREMRCGLRESELAGRDMAISESTRELDSREQELARLETSLKDRERQLGEREARLDGSIQEFESRVIVRGYRKLKSFL